MHFPFFSAPIRFSAPMRAAAVTVVTAVLLSACSFFAPYRIDVRQGNFVNQIMLAQLKPGMTRDQVRFVLGSPLVVDVFRTDRWDYIYRFKSGHGDVQQRTISVFFIDGLFERIEGDMGELKGEAATQNLPRVIEVPKVKD
ncbi:MAG: outer membrane protein assembly factor BamE [Azoarcus sp.]|jgi:outer membrane protein assembly factor BamE|nr:outer membrane protein assembly factor BamE [Azoarcus sp.]